MGSDMIVALQEASANESTLFALNHHADPGARFSACVCPGHMHDAGEEVAHLADLALPQARQTYTVLGLQPIGHWGFTHGVNEQRVAIGVTDWQSKTPGVPTQLGGFDLVRLALERSHGAHHAVEVLTDLLERHGQREPDGGGDHIFLIADAREAFVLETAGRFWAMFECGQTRVVTDAAMIRQDWRRLAPGLSDFVVEKRWWVDDGSKIDFVRCLGEKSERTNNAHKRWGHASLALAQQQGAIDDHFLRRMLADHYNHNREFLPDVKSAALASSFLTDLHNPDHPAVAWIAFGAPKTALYFPLCMFGEVPAGFDGARASAYSIQERCLELQKLAQGKDRSRVITAVERLQTRFDQDAEDFVTKASDYVHHGKPYLVGQVATEMMHHHVELFDKEYRRLLGIEDVAPHRLPVVAEEVMFFA